MTWLEFAGTVIGSGAVGSAVNEIFHRRKTKAEAVTIAMDGTVKWAESMRIDVEALKKQYNTLQEKFLALVEENKELKIEVHKLHMELAQYKKGS